MFTIAFFPDSSRNQILNMLWGLIRGLAFLHKNLVAHRDVKPDNLVIDNNRDLKIIDFDIAVRLTSEDQELEGDYGTEGWKAPEMMRHDPDLMVSPIRCDRWACGHVILRLLEQTGKDDVLLMQVAEELKSADPMKRPSLPKVLERKENRLLSTKADRTHQIPFNDSMELKGKRRKGAALQHPLDGLSTRVNIAPVPGFWTSVQ